MRVVYKDSKSNTFSAPIEWDATSSAYLMRTNVGLQKIEYVFRDDRAGNLFFDCYREDIPPAEPDKLHLLPRQPGESSLAQLQRSVGAQELQARTERQQAIHNQVTEADARDTAKVRQARDINNQLAQRLKPTRDIEFPPSEQETAAAQRARRAEQMDAMKRAREYPEGMAERHRAPRRHKTEP